MNFRKLGKSDVTVSEISLGCWTMGGLNWVNGTPNGWANVDEDEVAAAIKVAVDAGVNHFDNADVYGNGRAERMLARALIKLGVRSDDFVIASKVGHFPGTAAHAYEPLHIRHQCEQSLINLQRDYLDVYYLHHGDFGGDDQYLAGAAEALDRLVQEGKVRLKGQSAYSDTDFLKAVPVVKPAVLQTWAHAMDTQFIRPGSPVAKLMQDEGLSLVAFSPLNQGLLLDKYRADRMPTFAAGDYRRNQEKFSEAAVRELTPKLANVKARFGDRTEDLAAVAQRYILNHDHVACVIPGFRNEKQVRCNLAAKDRSLNDGDMTFIREVFEA